ncbi:hypothetical protein [Schlesneria sp.]|uniref:hypothetical protein n=1 Tax=Schlesneria sp. TaxID=2762018 RepID=UPI002F145C8C
MKKNSKDQRRKKKLEEKSKSKRDHEESLKLRSVYPDFVFDETESQTDPAFVALIKDAIRQFRFTELHPMDRTAFKDMKKFGAAYPVEMIRRAMKENQANGVQTPHSMRGDFLWWVSVGETIFGKIPESDRKNFLPINNVRFLYRGTAILVQFYSLLSHRHAGSTLCYSRREPQIELDGQRFTVAFSNEAMKRIGERTVHQPFSYTGVGEFFAFMDLCANYEPCTLRDGGLAFTFFDYCTERMWSSHYVTEVLGEDKLDPKLGEPYYRVGYCPIVIVDDRFALAKTLLFPGFSKTPEYQALQVSRLPYAEKERLKAVATHDLTLAQIQKTRDFSALKWFQENGVPQVIQTQKKMFHVYGDSVKGHGTSTLLCR